MDNSNSVRAEQIAGENVIIANTVIAHQGIHMHAHGSGRLADELPTLILSAFARPLPDNLPSEPRYPSPTWASESEFTVLPLFYASERNGEQIKITPVNPYLEAVNNGGPLHTLNTTNPWYDVFHFPTFDVKLVNNTDRTVFFHEAEFRVTSSKADRQPIPAVLGLLGSLYVRFTNFGWAPIRNASLRFAMTAVDENSLEDAPLRLPEFLPHNIFLGDIESSKVFTLLPFFQIEGVDTNRLADLLYVHWDTSPSTVHFHKELEFRYESTEPGGEDRYVQARELPRADYEHFLKKAAGRFYKSRPCLAGLLSYEETADDGSCQKRSVSVFSLLDFQRHGLGAGAPPSNEYHVKLDVDGENYVRRLQLSHTLKPGETDRFLIQVAADRSSVHELTFALRFNNDELVETPVHLEIFCSPIDAHFARGREFNQQ